MPRGVSALNPRTVANADRREQQLVLHGAIGHRIDPVRNGLADAVAHVVTAADHDIGAQ